MRVQQEIKDTAGDVIKIEVADGAVELDMDVDMDGDVIGWYEYSPKRAREFALALLRAADAAEGL